MKYVLLSFWLFSLSLSSLYAQESSHLIEWSTYVGITPKSFNQTGDFALTTDNKGNVIIAACVNSKFAMATPHAFQPTIAGGDDILIAKFSQHGILLWATYYGGTGFERGGEHNNWIAVDSLGNVFVTGMTYSSDFPVTPYAFRKENVDSDGFLIKFSPTGERLWATLYGGNKIDVSHSIAVDKQGNPVIIGTTNSTDLPAQNGFMQHLPIAESMLHSGDIFIARFSTDGTHLWSTYYGAERSDNVDGVAVNYNGNIVILGHTYSRHLPVSNDALQSSLHIVAPQINEPDLFVTTFDSSGRFLWGTYYGAAGAEWGRSIVVAPDSSIIVGGEKYIFGSTGNEREIPGTNTESFMQYPNDRLVPNYAFMFKLTHDGKMRWATYIGACLSGDNVLAVSCDGRISVSFTSKSRLIPRHEPLNFPIVDTAKTFYFAEFSADGKNLLWGSYYVFGQFPRIVFNPDGDIAIAGWIHNPILPVTDGAYQEKLEPNSSSLFITQFGCKSNKPTVLSSPILLCGSDSAIISAPEGFNTYLWRPTGETTRSITVRTSGSHRLYVSDSLGCSNVSDPITVMVLPPPQVHITTSTTTACQGDSIRLEVQRSTEASILWSTGDTTDVIYVHSSGIYSVTTFYGQPAQFTSACRAADSIAIKFHAPSDVQTSTTALVLIADPCRTATRQTVTITNTSDEIISISNIGIDGNMDIAIVYPENSDINIPSGDSIEVLLQYNGSSTSTSGTLQFYSLPCGYQYVVELSGKTSSLSLPDSLDLGCLLSCLHTHDSLISITNTGTVDITLDAVEVKAPFTAFLPVATLLPAGGQTFVTTGITAQTAGNYTGVIILRYHTGQCATTATIPVRATVETLDITAVPVIDFGNVIMCSEPVITTTSVIDVAGSCTQSLSIRSVQLSGPFSTSLQAGSDLPTGHSEFTLTFMPVDKGMTTGTLTLVLEPCGTTLSIPLSGTALGVEYTVDSDVDFPIFDIDAADYSEQTIVFRNTSLFPITIDNLSCLAQPFEVIAPSAAQLPVLLQPGEPLSIHLRFSPKQTGDFHDTLCISGNNPCLFTDIVAISASAFAIDVNARSLVEIPIMKTQVGYKDFAIPLILTGEEFLRDVQASAFRTTIHIDTRFFKPESISRGTFTERHIGETLFIDIEAQLPSTPQTGDTLLSIIGLPLYSNSKSTPVVFDSFEWIDAEVEEHTQDGKLDLEICLPQGIQTLHRIDMTIVGEHPVREQIKVHISNVYEGTLLELWSLTGQKLLSQVVQSDGEFILPVGRTISAGIYRLIMSGPFDTMSIPVLIVK